MIARPNKRKKTLKLSKRLPYVLLLLIGCWLGFYLTKYYTRPHKILRGDCPPIKLFFSPKGGCAQHVIDTINQAEKKIYIAMFVFTRKDIAEALVAAKKRGVDIHIIAHKQQADSCYSQLKKLDQHNIDIYTDGRKGIFHHKWLAVDKKIILTGSYNYSKKAENSNNEIIGHIESPAVAERYYQDWQTHIQHPKVCRYGSPRLK